jgi:hypothetical protein
MKSKTEICLIALFIIMQRGGMTLYQVQKKKTESLLGAIYGLISN